MRDDALLCADVIHPPHSPRCPYCTLFFRLSTCTTYNSIKNVLKENSSLSLRIVALCLFFSIFMLSCSICCVNVVSMSRDGRTVGEGRRNGGMGGGGAQLGGKEGGRGRAVLSSSTYKCTLSGWRKGTAFQWKSVVCAVKGIQRRVCGEGGGKRCREMWQKTC